MVVKILSDKRLAKIAEIMFWIVFGKNFRPHDKLFLENCRKLLSKHYSKFFFTPPVKNMSNDLEECMVVMISYAIHYAFFYRFQSSINRFTQRFILDCYHFTIFELNGFKVADEYVKTMIEKYIGRGKFLFYYKEREEL